jgi:hypothetical protein
VSRRIPNRHFDDPQYKIEIRRKKMQGSATRMGETTTQAEVGAVMSLVNSVVELLEDLPLTENGTGHVPKGTKGRVIRTNGGDLVAVRFPRGNYWCNIKELRILS